MMRKPLTRTERQCLCGVLLLCVLPLGYAYYTSLKKKAQQEALNKYTDTVVIGHPSYVRLKYGYKTGGSEGDIGLFVPHQTPHLHTLFYSVQRDKWRLVFVEDLPDLSGGKTIGALVTVPKEMPLEVAKHGMAVQLVRTRDGEKSIYEGKIKTK